MVANVISYSLVLRLSCIKCTCFLPLQQEIVLNSTRMKKLALPLIAALFLAACQNSTPSPDQSKAAQAQESAAATAVDMAKIKDAAGKATTLQQDIKTLLVDVNAASASFKGKQKADIDAIASQLNDLTAKEDMMAEAIAAAQKNGSAESSTIVGASASPEALKDYMESIDRYAIFVGELRAQFEAIKNGSAK
jgi:outer membrane PBP1 activator LpoA protein